MYHTNAARRTSHAARAFSSFMMTRIARGWLGLALIAALLAYGGAGDLVQPLLTVAIAITAVLVAASLRQQFHCPPLAWIALLFLPPLALALLQVLPLGWHHPWISEDARLLGVTPSAWSIDPAASTAVLVWFATLAGLALTVCLLARGDRVRALVEVLIAVAASCALLGLLLALTAAPWPSDSGSTRARGPFIYPNHAAAFWAACLPLATLTAHRRGGLLRWGAVALLALAILLSGSRGGILVAALVMLPLSVGLLPRVRRWWWAAGGAVAVACWLWLIGLSDVTDKFNRLRGAEGVTLNGRVIIWEAALPVAMDAGVLGSGGGTTLSAYRRSGDTHFTDVLVDHLHNDPLEWWLEFGWLGLLIGAGALGATLIRLRPQADAWHDPGRRMLIVGASAGLLSLGLHACGDFVWHAPAVAVTGVLLLCVLALAGRIEQRATTGRTRALLLCGSSAVVLLVGVWCSWDWHVSELRARDVERLALARVAAGLPLSGAEAVTRALKGTPGSVRLAIDRAWLAHVAGDLDGARAALVHAAHLAPGDASAWAQRALLSARTTNGATTSAEIMRALHWAPAWPDIQQVALQLVAAQVAVGQRHTVLSEIQTATIISAVLSNDRAQPPWFFPLARDVLGEQLLLTQLRQAGPTLARSAEPWLAAQGPLEEWLALRQRGAAAATAATTTTTQRQSAIMGLVNDRLIGATAWQPMVPLEQEERRALAEQLTTLALPVPVLLADVLQRDGPPWSRWARPIDLLDELTRAELSQLLRSELHRGWARLWADRLALTGRALGGDSAMITRDCPPPVLARLAGIMPYHDPATAVDETISSRARLLLERWRDWEWQELPGAGRWAWYFCDDSGDDSGDDSSDGSSDGSGHAVITTKRWTGLVVDGEWRGWIRGQQDLAPLLGHGLKRVVLLEP